MKVTYQLSHGGLRHVGYKTDRGCIVTLCGCPATGSGHKTPRNIQEGMDNVTCARGLKFRQGNLYK